MLKTYTWPRYAYKRPPELGQSAVLRAARGGGGCRPGGPPSAAIDAALRGMPVVLLDDDDTVSVGSRGVCYTAQAHAGDLRPPGCRRRGGREGGDLERRPHLPPRQRGLRLQPAARTRPSAAGHGEPAAIPPGASPGGARGPAAGNRLALAAQGGGRDAGRCRCHPRHRNRRRPLHAAVRLAHRGRRRTQPDPPRARPGYRRQGLPGPLPDRRRRARRPSPSRPTAPSAASGSTRPSIRGQIGALLHQRGRTASGASTSSSAGTPDPELEAKQPERREHRADDPAPCSAARATRTSASNSNGSRSTQFACRRIDRFRYGRVLFAGDAAHQVSPFGARGANTGVQDIDNLALEAQAPCSPARRQRPLVDSYHAERAFAADDNLRASTRSTDFITPKSRASLRLRNAVLDLARSEPFRARSSTAAGSRHPRPTSTRR